MMGIMSTPAVEETDPGVDADLEDEGDNETGDEVSDEEPAS